MAKPQKAKKDNVEEKNNSVRRRNHKKTARRREEQKALDPRDPAVLITVKQKNLSFCTDKLEEKAKTMPTKSRVVLKGNMLRISQGEEIAIPRGMPFCDEQDVRNDLEWFRKIWTEYQVTANALKQKYGRAS